MNQSQYIPCKWRDHCPSPRQGLCSSGEGRRGWRVDNEQPVLCCLSPSSILEQKWRTHAHVETEAQGERDLSKVLSQLETKSRLKSRPDFARSFSLHAALWAPPTAPFAQKHQAIFINHAHPLGTPWRVLPGTDPVPCLIAESF